MRFDEIDLKIFNLFVESDLLTSTEIAKRIFYPKNRDELIAKNSLIDYRMKKWRKSGLIINKIINKVRHYGLNDEIITFGESHLTVNGTQINMGQALIIDLKKNGYIIKFLDED